MFPNLRMNLETKTIEEKIHFSPDMELRELFDIELPLKDVENALQLLEFCKVFGNVWFCFMLNFFCPMFGLINYSLLLQS